MPKQLVQALLLSACVLAIGSATAAPAPTADACRGIALPTFEQRFPDQVRRYPLDHGMLEPFVQLWRAAKRPALPVLPERVTIYALPGRPFLVGYQRGGCVIAFLSVDRQRFWRWLRPHLGWSV